VPNFDLIVVGGGTIGLAAAYHAAARGLKVVVLDQYDVPNQSGSSRGLDRMFRIMYSQAERVRLVESSYALWHEMEDFIGEKILAERDLLFFGHSEGPPGFEGSLKAIRQAMDQLGIPHDFLGSPAEIARRYPIYVTGSMPADYVGLVQNNGATINVRASFDTILQLAQKTNNLTIASGSRVASLKQISATWYVTAVDKHGSQNYQSNYLILCPGIWLDSILPYVGLQTWKGSPMPWSIWQMTLAYFPVPPGRSDHWPIWYEFGNLQAADQKLFYGFPDNAFTPETAGKMKISVDFTNTIVADPSQLTNQPDPQIIAAIQARLRTLCAPGVVDIDNPTLAQACPYSMSPDGDLVLGRIPIAPVTPSYWTNASFCCMASGRGFKYTPLFGRILVELAVDGQTSYVGDIQDFSPIRPNIFQRAAIPPT
jgi:glycine/D-amino acid oxidase-like deaminating enzyme